VANDKVIHVTAVALRGEDGRVLTVRKRGTHRFMLPGGKPEAGETDRQAAVRECAEELGVELRVEDLRLVGVFRAEAANEPGYDCEETLFTYPDPVVATAHAEIEEVRWLDLTEPFPGDTSPLLRHNLPQLAHRRGLDQVTVFAGSATGDDPAYSGAVAALGAELARRGLGIVYGGGHIGLMGVLADAALASGGGIVGVMPQSLVNAEIAHPGLTRLDVVPDMTTRKAEMERLGDAFIAVPGGAGTLEEFFETWTWLQLGLHDKPVALYNVAGFWSPLLDTLRAMVSAGFLAQIYVDALIVVDDPLELIEALTTWRRPTKKWRGALDSPESAVNARRQALAPAARFAATAPHNDLDPVALIREDRAR
jgi:uncharacterized protein (TIGR00730 family)